MTESGAFDNFAVEYDQWFDNHPVEYVLELEAIKRLLPTEGTGIEIGAGTGRFTKALEISQGIEPSQSMRKIAASRDVNIIDGLAESLPVTDSLYDYALLVTTVCFLEEPELAFKEIFRILKDDGFIIIGFIDKDSNLGKEYRTKKKQSKFYKNAHFYSVAETESLLINNGFGNIQTVQAILPADITDNSTPRVMQGYGKGSFVVIRAQKQVVKQKDLSLI